MNNLTPIVDTLATQGLTSIGVATQGLAAPSVGVAAEQSAQALFGAEVEVSAEQSLKTLFGSAAEVVEQSVATAQSVEQVASELAAGHSPLVHNGVMMVALAALFVGYVVLMAHYGSSVGGMYKVIFGRNISSKVADEMSLLFVKATRLFCLEGLAAWALVAVGTLSLYGFRSVEGVENTHSLGPIVILAMVAIFVVQCLTTRLMSSLMRQHSLGEGLEMLSTAIVGLSAVVVAPLTLLFAINDGGSAVAIALILLAVAAVMLLCYITKSFIFFVEQKISILLWILYLCAVVLLPLGILAATLLQNSTL